MSHPHQQSQQPNARLVPPSGFVAQPLQDAPENLQSFYHQQRQQRQMLHKRQREQQQRQQEQQHQRSNCYQSSIQSQIPTVPTMQLPIISTGIPLVAQVGQYHSVRPIVPAVPLSAALSTSTENTASLHSSESLDLSTLLPQRPRMLLIDLDSVSNKNEYASQIIAKRDPLLCSVILQTHSESGYSSSIPHAAWYPNSAYVSKMNHGKGSMLVMITSSIYRWIQYHIDTRKCKPSGSIVVVTQARACMAIKKEVEEGNPGLTIYFTNNDNSTNDE